MQRHEYHEVWVPGGCSGTWLPLYALCPLIIYILPTCQIHPSPLKAPQNLISLLYQPEVQWCESHLVVSNSATPWTIQSMEFFRPEYWSRYRFLSPGDFPNPGIEPRSPTLWADRLPAEPQGSSRILEWVAYPFSRGSSHPRNWTGVLLHCTQILYQLSYQGSPEFQNSII